MTRLQCFALLLILFFTATAAHARRAALPADVIRAMDDPWTLTLYSVDPDPRAAHWFNHRLHGHRILGSTAIHAAEDRLRVASSIKQAIRSYAGVDYKCIFSPRHAVRFSRGDQSYDFLICYECQELNVYRGDRLIFSQSIAGSSVVLDRLLQRRH